MQQIGNKKVIHGHTSEIMRIYDKFDTDISQSFVSAIKYENTSIAVGTS
jgi:hypothetical protein